jgi:hypothetical protein
MDRCPKNMTGGSQTLALVSTTSVQPRSHGNFCDAIPTITRPIDLLLAKRRQIRSSPTRSPSAGGCDFAADPGLRADRTSVVWLPHLNPATVVVAPAPARFTEATAIGGLTLSFSRRAADGQYWLVEDGAARLPVVLIDGADAAAPAAVVLPLDGSIGRRAEAALRLWRAMTGQARGRPPADLTAQQRSRLGLALRGLDGRLAGCSYRTIAEFLFGPAQVPSGPAWKTHDLRDRTIRVCRRGVDLMRGGYLNLLRHPRRFRS